MAVNLRRSIWRSNAASGCATPTPRSDRSDRPCPRPSRISAGSLGTADPCGTVSSARAFRRIFFLFLIVLSHFSFNGTSRLMFHDRDAIDVIKRDNSA